MTESSEFELLELATQPLRPPTTTHWFGAAVKRCQSADARFPRVTVHELRHTAASLMIASGANVKTLQAQLGHKTATMTLDQYGHLFPDDLDDVAVKMEDLVSGCAKKCAHNGSRPGRKYALTCCYSSGAAGNRTRVLRHSLKASPCAVRYVSTWISCSREQVRMTIPVAVWCPRTSRDRTYGFVPLADARVRVEGSPGLTDSQSLMQRERSQRELNRRLIGCNDAYGGLLPAPARFP